MTLQEFQNDIRAGIPDRLPAAKPYDKQINHAPKRKGILTPEEEVLAIAEILLCWNDPIDHPQLPQRYPGCYQLACELAGMLPASETPRYTEGYEGFYHLDSIGGDVMEAHMSYIIRDHDRNIFERRKAVMTEAVAALNEKYGAGTVELDLSDSYYNMKEIIDQHPHLMENAKAVMRELGMEPEMLPVRGGTDGSRLSYMGLPCPNLGTGGYAFHGPMEHITKEGLEMASKVVLGLIAKYA